MLVFAERGKPEYPEKNLSEQSREPTNSAHLWRRVRESNPGHIGGRRALSPLRQPCSPRMRDQALLEKKSVKRVTSFALEKLTASLLALSIGVRAEGNDQNSFFCQLAISEMWVWG